MNHTPMSLLSSLSKDALVVKLPIRLRVNMPVVGGETSSSRWGRRDWPYGEGIGEEVWKVEIGGILPYMLDGGMPYPFGAPP